MEFHGPMAPRPLQSVSRAPQGPPKALPRPHVDCFPKENKVLLNIASEPPNKKTRGPAAGAKPLDPATEPEGPVSGRVLRVPVRLGIIILIMLTT